MLDLAFASWLADRVVVDDATGCWLYTGHTVNGYAQVKWRGRNPRLHRLVYEQAVGPIPAGLVLDHLCRRRHCVRPEHLEPVTQWVNIMRGRGLAPEQAARSACPQGHAYTDANTKVYRGRRYCRACHRAHSRAYRARKAVA